MILERKRTLQAGKRLIEDIDKLPDFVKDDSIILIGPMGTGKSSVSKELSSRHLNLPRISLDDRKAFSNMYNKKKKFKDFKKFEFILTGMVLSSLHKPHIIDFGAGHSIQEDKEINGLLTKMLSKYPNIFLLLPSEDREKSEEILRERRHIKKGSNDDFTNHLFLNLPNNKDIAKNIIYEEGKTIEEVSDEIIELVNERKKQAIKINDELEI